jgi:hypothetical protein
MTRKILLTLTLALTAVAPAGARAYLPEGFIGVSPQNPASRVDYRLMGEAGVTSVRLPLNWVGIEPESPWLAPPNWSGFDDEVALAAEADIRIMPFVTSAPEWVTRDPLVMPVHSSGQRRAWSAFLRKTVARYGPGGVFWEEHPDLPYLPIRHWEIWNEENIVSFAERPDPASFAALVRISGKTLHRADPGAEVVLGGLFGRPLQIPPNVASGDYLSRVYRARNVKRYFDGVALHPYVARAKAMGAQIENLRRIMRRHHDAATPIYVTELGWGSDSGPTRWERGLYGQARQLSNSFALLSAHRREWRVAGAWWFTWTDEGGSCQFCRSAGLLTEKRRAKPAWYRFNAWTGGDADIVPRALFGPAGEELEEAEVPSPIVDAVTPAPAP